MDELLADFLIETSESLAEADKALLRLEQVPRDQTTLAVVFRAIHTIKGSSGFLPLPRLGRVAHAAEDVLVAVRDGTVAADATLISGLLAALDRIKLIVDSLNASGAEPPGDDSSLIAELAALTRGETGPGTLVAGRPSSESAGGVASAQTIRVSVGLLETLMTLVSELVLTRNQLVQLSPREGNNPFEAGLQRLSNLTSDLQEGVMKTRMQPIGSLQNTLQRLVRVLSHDLAKPIEFALSGGETELDRQVLEMMRDPLIHMIRNSADHGIEPAAVRRTAGKPACGHIQLHAYHEGGHVILQLSDDGAGLPMGRIGALAVARGLVSEEELAALGESQIQHFIFTPGFSTAASVTSVSGRGVGMEVVKANIERIGGTIGVQSVEGRGTLLTLRIPLTLAIISAFILEARGERFALPQANVVELVRIADEEELASGQGQFPPELIDGAPMLRLRDHLLPLVHLGDVLRLDGPPGTLPGSIVVVLAVDGVSLGLVVDRVFDTEEIVVKPLNQLLRHITMFGGKTILGDGTVIMILEPTGIARTLGLTERAAYVRPALPAPELAEHSDDLAAMLLFRPAPHAPPAAAPLALVARIETIGPAEVERSAGRPVMQYRGAVMPLVSMLPWPEVLAESQPVLVFSDRGRTMGLLAHEVVDVVEERLAIEMSSSRPGLLGTAVIAGRITDVIDAGYWLTQAWQDWFHAEPKAIGTRKRLLVVEDSSFFRQLLVPMLAAAGYSVTSVESAARALALRDGAAEIFDAIISDVEMPGMDGLEFARRIRAEGAWRYTPLLALSGRLGEADSARGREAGFSEYVGKLDRETLLAALDRCMALAELRIA